MLEMSFAYGHVDDLHRVSRQRDFIGRDPCPESTPFNGFSAAILQEGAGIGVQQLVVNNNRPGVIEGSKPDFPNGRSMAVFPPPGVNHCQSECGNVMPRSRA